MATAAVRSGATSFLRKANGQGTLQAGQALQITNAAEGVDLRATVTASPGASIPPPATAPESAGRTFRLVAQGAVAKGFEFDVALITGGMAGLKQSVGDALRGTGPVRTLDLDFSLGPPRGAPSSAILMRYQIVLPSYRDPQSGAQAWSRPGYMLQGEALMQSGQAVPVFASPDGGSLTLTLTEITPRNPLAQPAP